MKHAISILENSLESNSKNASIHRGIGHDEQADLDEAVAADCKNAVEILSTQDFGWAIRQLELGKRVARRGWNGKGMYLWLMPAATVKSEWCREPFLKELAEANGGEIEALGSIRMLTADKKVLTGWLASQTDMLAKDWELVG